MSKDAPCVACTPPAGACVACARQAGGVMHFDMLRRAEV